MIESRTIHIDGVGPVLFERSMRARRVVISVKPSRGARVAIPHRVSFKQALEFANLKKPWIRKHLARARRIEIQRQAAVATAIIDKIEAGKKLTRRLKKLAEKYGFAFSRITIRNQKTRWGSCSHNGNISLNIKLVLLPGELVDYVILHELVHTRVHNHGDKFWSELDKYVGDGKALAKKLRKYGMGLL